MTLRSPAQPELECHGAVRVSVPFFLTTSLYGTYQPIADLEYCGPRVRVAGSGAPRESTQPAAMCFASPAMGTRLAISSRTQKEE
jgi:hypothetical protein